MQLNNIHLWGDGIHDDTAGLQYLIDTGATPAMPEWFPKCDCGQSVMPGEDNCYECLGTQEPVTTIELPSGNYMISSGLTISTNNVTISNCHIISTNSQQPILTVKDTARQCFITNSSFMYKNPNPNNTAALLHLTNAIRR